MTLKLPTSPMLSEVHTILESKIQHIEYQAQCNLQECVCGRSAVPGPTKNKADTLTQNFEWMLQQINLRNGELKLLQIIKCWLRVENLPTVMELLQENNFLKYSEDDLERLLKKGALELMRLQYRS